MKRVDAVVYTSHTGFTARYARALAAKTGLPCRSLEEPGPRGQRVVYLSWLRAGSLCGLKKAQGRYDVAALGVVGMSPTPNGKAMEDMTLPAFYLPGGYAPEKLKGVYKLMMAAMGKALSRTPPKDPEETAMLRAFREGCDWVDEKHLEPLLAWLNEEEEQ